MLGSAMLLSNALLAPKMLKADAMLNAASLMMARGKLLGMPMLACCAANAVLDASAKHAWGCVPAERCHLVSECGPSWHATS